MGRCISCEERFIWRMVIQTSPSSPLRRTMAAPTKATLLRLLAAALQHRLAPISNRRNEKAFRLLAMMAFATIAATPSAVGAAHTTMGARRTNCPFVAPPTALLDAGAPAPPPATPSSPPSQCSLRKRVSEMLQALEEGEESSRPLRRRTPSSTLSRTHQRWGLSPSHPPTGPSPALHQCSTYRRPFPIMDTTTAHSTLALPPRQQQRPPRRLRCCGGR